MLRHLAALTFGSVAAACVGSAPQGALPAQAPPAIAASCPKETPSAPERLRFRVSLAEAAAQAAVSGRLIVAMTQAKDVDDPSGHNANNPDFGHEFDHPGGIWFAALDIYRLGASGAVELDPDVFASPRPFSLAPSGSWRISARLLRDGVQVLQGPVVERTVDPAHAGIVDLGLDAAVPPRPAPTETDSMKLVRVDSKRLSAFYGRPITMEAIVQVPTSYSADRTRHYATAYTILGWGTSLAGTWPWQAKLGKARAEQRYPEMVHVVLLVMLPEHCGHHGFADSVNSGPWGTALVEELIPELEKRFRLVREPRARLLTGHSGGGWSSLWVQITHPAFFGGVWSVSPDPVDFRSLHGIDVTPGSADNVYVTKDGKPRNFWRTGGQEAVYSIEEFVRMDDVLDRGGAMSSYDWIESPRGPTGRPLPLFDHATGVLDPTAQRAWEKYDIRKVLSDGWATLGPQLESKLHVFTGAEDTFHGEEAVALLCDFLKSKGSHATCEILPGKNHFNVYGLPNDPASLRWRIEHEMAAAAGVH